MAVSIFYLGFSIHCLIHSGDNEPNVPRRDMTAPASGGGRYHQPSGTGWRTGSQAEGRSKMGPLRVPGILYRCVTLRVGRELLRAADMCTDEQVGQ